MTIRSLSAWKDQALELVREHLALAEPVTFLLGFAESIVFLSLFVPSSALFLGIGGVHSAAGGQFWTTWLAGASGAFLGDNLSFLLGRYFKNEIAQAWPLNRRPEWYAATVAIFRKWGIYSILGGKFLGFVRPFLPVVAGALHMGWPRFVFASAVSSLAWAGVFLAPGYGLAWFFG